PTSFVRGPGRPPVAGRFVLHRLVPHSYRKGKTQDFCAFPAAAPFLLVFFWCAFTPPARLGGPDFPGKTRGSAQAGAPAMNRGPDGEGGPGPQPKERSYDSAGQGQPATDESFLQPRSRVDQPCDGSAVWTSAARRPPAGRHGAPKQLTRTARGITAATGR